MEHHHHYQDYQQYPPPLPPPQYQPPPQQQQHYDYGTTVSHIPPPPPPPPPQHYPYNPHPHHPYNYGETVSHMHPPPMPPPHQYPPPSYPPHPHPHHNQHHYGETVSHMNHHHHPQQRRQHRPSSKRPRETGVDFGGETVLPSTKRQAIGNDVLFRVVVPSGHIGKVIGKGGHRVQKVRDDTKATIKIADPIARFEERVIIINSKEKSDGGMTDAEKALLQIAALILVDDGSTAPTLSSSSADPNAAAATTAASAGHVATNSVKLLIAGSQAGGLIGVSGQNIEKIRSSSGAAIAVLAPNQVPMCASAHDSDRLVQISGESPAVLKAVEEIGVELRANPPKQVISISPTYNLSITRGAQPHMDPYAAECVTLDMVISETMVGGLIGRAGSNIARIRNESGAMIKVFGGKGELKHRQIQLIGTAEQVALAKQRVDEYVYTQLTQSGGDE